MRLHRRSSAGAAGGLARKLTDAVGAVHRLRIARRVPVAVVEDHRIGTGEVDALTTSLRGQEESEDLVVCSGACTKALWNRNAKLQCAASARP